MQNRVVPKWYLYISLIYSLVSIVTSAIYFEKDMTPVIVAVWLPFMVLWFAINVVSLNWFYKKVYSRLILFLPIFYILDQPFSFVIGYANRLYTGQELGASPYIILVGLFIPIITLVLTCWFLLTGHGTNDYQYDKIEIKKF